MNKRKVEQMLSTALAGLKDPNCGIIEDGTEVNGIIVGGHIDKNFRGQIAAFGAAVTMGSFQSAIAFFGAQNGSEVKRDNLVRLMYYITTGRWVAKDKTLEIVDEILTEKDSAKLRTMQEDFLNASLAVKLALNAFHLE